VVAPPGGRRNAVATVTSLGEHEAAAITTGIRHAYGRTGARWAAGPARVYDRLAMALLADGPVPLTGARVLDAGAGTGAVSRAARAAGADVVAVDNAFAMLAHDRRRRPPAAAADIQRLPFGRDRFDLAVMAFVLNHLPEPELAITELVRVVRRDGWVLASVFRDGWDHPAKQAVEDAAAAYGYVPPAWYRDLKSRIASRAGRPDLLAEAGRRAGLVDVEVAIHEVDVGIADAPTLVAWRLGMANLAPFVASLDPARRRALVARAVETLGPRPPALRPQVVHLHGRVGDGAMGQRRGGRMRATVTVRCHRDPMR
jgi:ubiquinone/menaquinone biosynthesis C-methylase UbiE